MDFLKGTLALSLSCLLTACGGGDGYYNKDSSNIGGSDSTNTTTPEAIQKTFNSLKVEAASLFGHADSEHKGYVDHAIDTYAQSILKITNDIRKLNFTAYKDSNYLDRCFPDSKTDFRSCYVFQGDEINTLLGNEYSSWDFDINKGVDSSGNAYDDLANIRLKSSDIEPNLEKYYGKTYLLVFSNENPQKNLQDIAIAGSFSHPFVQTNGLQKRFILINEETSDYKITVTNLTNNTKNIMGALSIYKVPATSDNSEYYVTEAGSGFNTLINDNTNVAFAEPINFRIDSKLGVAPSTYKISKNIETLNLPSVSISGTRVEHDLPSLNAKEISGSIFIQGPNIFDFRKSAINSIFQFKHTLNEIHYEGQTKNIGTGIITEFTTPSSLKY